MNDPATATAATEPNGHHASTPADPAPPTAAPAAVEANGTSAAAAGPVPAAPAAAPVMTCSDFTVLKLLGTGGFAKVYLVQHIASGKLYAMKVMNKVVRPKLTKAAKRKAKEAAAATAAAAAAAAAASATASVESLDSNPANGTSTPPRPGTPKAGGSPRPKIYRDGVNERDILASINQHPFLVTLRWAFQDQTHLYLILDWAEGGEMWEYVAKEGLCIESTASFYVAEILLALEHLHSMKIIYRDLKLENILIDASGHIKLTDFGLAKFAFTEDMQFRANSFCGTFDYMAPEMIQRKPYDERVDVWGLGILTYYMLSGGPPFTGRTPKDVETGILSRKPKIPGYFTREAAAFITKLLQKDPDNRPKLADLKTHPFFRNIDWPALAALRSTPPHAPPKDAIHGEVQALLNRARRVKSVMTTDHGVEAMSVLPFQYGDLDHPLEELEHVFRDFHFPPSPAVSPPLKPEVVGKRESEEEEVRHAPLDG
ncbi:hypothetical protein H9P43_008121 [Blastocladiella emersonii ATCC 22665]|nr:hypothetical protein H9P43_008121 [Blastocladiella emersonii ATCC 22665]